eukprot:scaffold9347_cov64-Phaeocystis_antarctica.AAC.2
MLGFYRRSIGQRRHPLEVRGRLHELRCRARPRPPSNATRPAQLQSPHAVCPRIVRCRPHNPRRQRLDMSSSSFHHSGLATSAHSSRRSMSKALAVARAQSSVPRAPSRTASLAILVPKGGARVE